MALIKTIIAFSGQLWQYILLYLLESLRHGLAFTGESLTRATSKPFSCSSNGKWSSLTTSKWGWLWSFFGGQRRAARQLAEFISLCSMPLLVAECQGEVTQWETASLSVGGMSFSLSLMQAHWFPLEVQLPLPQTLLCTTGDISFKKELLNKHALMIWWKTEEH